MSELPPAVRTDMLPVQVGAIDPTLAGTTTIHEVGKWGIAVADAIAAEEPLNSGCAEMSMRNLAGLTNRMDVEDYLGLPKEDQGAMKKLAGEVVTFLHGEKAAEEAQRLLGIFRPRSPEEARFIIMQGAFNDLQIKVSIGVGPGYKPEQELRIREFIRSYARVFSGALFGLSTSGNRLATNQHEMAYVLSTIQAATPRSMKS